MKPSKSTKIDSHLSELAEICDNLSWLSGKAVKRESAESYGIYLKDSHQQIEEIPESYVNLCHISNKHTDIAKGLEHNLDSLTALFKRLDKFLTS
jgi:hypothetical protein